MWQTMRLFCVLLIWVGVSAPLQARVTRVEIDSRTDVLNGKAFGDVGAYERLSGQIFYVVRVDNPHNSAIVDLRNAVNAGDGEVEFSADFVAFRPKDPHKGNGSMLLEVPNRGRPHIIALVDGGDADLSRDTGDGWLLRQGFTVVSVGWQWDAPGPDDLKLYAPIAQENGKRITGLLRGDLMPSHEMDEIALGHLNIGNLGGLEYPVAEPRDPRNVLTVRNSRDGKRTVIPASQWQFAETVNGKLTPSDRHIHLNGGFQPGRIYEYVYVVADPVVAGLGFAAVRDIAAYAKYGPANADLHTSRVIAEGISQNGRFLRDFLYEGFNADEQGKMALDGVLAHVAGAGRGSFNYRFAQPSRDGQPTSSIDFPTDIFPFTDLPETDPLTAARDGLLQRASADKVVPKIFLSNTSYEYWGRAAALISIDAAGKQDVPISDNVRIYHFTGLQHFSGPFPPRKGAGDLLGQQDESALPVKYFWRAMISNMDAWVRKDVAPPKSAYPRIDNGTLVPLQNYSFPPIPDVAWPQEASNGERLDFGPQWRSNGILSLQPPKVGKPFPVLVPQVNEDGNETDGVRLPEMEVPLGTYAGWNLRDPSISAPAQRVSFEASYIPFAKTAEERHKAADPRRSIAERYSSREDYLDRFGHALDALIEQRWVLPEDRAALMARGQQEWDEALR